MDLKVESEKMEEARELVSNRLLWPLVRDFLWDFAPQIHTSWMEEIQTSDYDFVKSEVRSPKSSPRIKRYILDSLGVEPCFHAFPKDDGSRLLLLDGATLVSVVKWLGALACADALRRVTDGATVRELKTVLSGVYPEVFGYTEYFRKSKVEGAKFEAKGHAGESIAEIGHSLLIAPINSLPKPLLERLKFKLPKAMSMPRSSDSRLSTSNFQLSNLQLLLKLRFPEAYKLCCS